tara:strand:+ start:412 stop:1053 length:642 start_codon:yes stop_codon:yes gene_type:complete
MLLTLNDKEYYIPQKWTEVSLSCYQKFMQIEKDTDKHTKALNTISCFTDAPFKTLEKCKKSDIDIVLKYVAKLLTKKVNTTLNYIIEVDGVEYGFNPNLKDMTMAEFVDLDNYLNDIWKNMHKIMAILYRPVIKRKNKKYNIEDYDSTKCLKVAEIFKDALSVATVNGASNFFLTIAKEYLNVLQLYSNKKKNKKKTYMTQNNNLATNGVGME